MIVNTIKSVDLELEVNVDVEQITQALQESLCDLQENPERRFVLQRFLNHCYGCLKAVDDKMVEQLPTQARQLVANALREQADRYAPEVPR